MGSVEVILTQPLMTEKRLGRSLFFHSLKQVLSLIQKAEKITYVLMIVNIDFVFKIYIVKDTDSWATME